MYIYYMDMMSSNQVSASRWANVRGGMLSKYLQWHNMAGILGIHFKYNKKQMFDYILLTISSHYKLRKYLPMGAKSLTATTN